MTEEERNAKARQSLFVMLGIDAAAAILFWIIKATVNDLPLAFGVLVVGLGLGATYYIYQSYKLRPKE